MTENQLLNLQNSTEPQIIDMWVKMKLLGLKEAAVKVVSYTYRTFKNAVDLANQKEVACSIKQVKNR